MARSRCAHHATFKSRLLCRRCLSTRISSVVAVYVRDCINLGVDLTRGDNSATEHHGYFSSVSTGKFPAIIGLHWALHCCEVNQSNHGSSMFATARPAVKGQCNLPRIFVIAPNCYFDLLRRQYTPAGDIGDGSKACL